MEFVNIYHFKFHPMLKYACVCCVRFVLIKWIEFIYGIVVNLALACSWLPSISVTISHLPRFSNFSWRPVSSLWSGMVLTSATTVGTSHTKVISSIIPILTVERRLTSRGCMASQNSNDPNGSPCCAPSFDLSRWSPYTRMGSHEYAA